MRWGAPDTHDDRIRLHLIPAVIDGGECLLLLFHRLRSPHLDSQGGAFPDEYPINPDKTSMRNLIGLALLPSVASLIPPITPILLLGVYGKNKMTNGYV